MSIPIFSLRMAVMPMMATMVKGLHLHDNLRLVLSTWACHPFPNSTW
jgi:hypothetical protein